MDESQQAVNDVVDVVTDDTICQAVPVHSVSMAAQSLSNASYTWWNRWLKSTNVTKGSL